MGRAPCCDKANVKKGPWSPEEDAKLKSYIEKHGTGGNWIALPQKIGLKRCGKSCRLRWLNYLRPNIKHGGFSEEEDKIILSLYVSIGSRWSIIAAQLPGRTDNDIKNYWNTRLKKKLLGKQRKDQQHARKGNNLIKQEDNRLVDPNSFNSSNVFNAQIPYWSYIPTPNNANSSPNYSNQASLVPGIHDHTSIRKLLMKVSGNIDSTTPFNHYHNTYPNIIPQMNTLHHQPLSDHSLAVSSLSMDSIINNTSTPSTSQMTNPNHYNTGEVGVAMGMLDGEGTTFPPELEELMSSNPRREDGLDFLYGDHYNNNLVNHDGSTSETMTCGEGSGWGEMGSLGSIPNLDSNCVVFEQGIEGGECRFDGNLRYPSQL